MSRQSKATTTVRRRAQTLLALVVASATSVVVPAAAHADPIDDPCGLAIAFLCRFVPIAPDLDHDVDLTVHPPSDPAGLPPDPPLPPDSLPTADVCANGCI